MTPGGASFIVDPGFRVARVDRRLFGSFVEHMGRCVYTGIFEPGHPSATEDGFRQDVLELVRELGVQVVRYPGGNFVSSYDWRDGVGAVESRPTRLNLAWRSIETNAFGLNEFIEWARAVGVEPMLAVNLGTRGVRDAVELIEYANYPGGTQLSDLRRAHGADKPHDVKLWCLGNEMDGDWQIGHKAADEYGRLASEAAKAMRLVDPSIELVVCGSSNRQMPTLGSWESTVLEHTYDQVDYVSLHAYYEEVGQDLESFLATSVDMDAFINEAVATADAVKARKGSKKTMMLAFDEWNVWYQARFAGVESLHWEKAPSLIEDEFNVADAVAVGSYLITLLRHADRVRIACQAQLANVIAPIRTAPAGPAWRQTIFHPFAQAAAFARGEALILQPKSPYYDTAQYGSVPLVDAAATYDEESGDLALFVVHRGLLEGILLDVDVRALPDHRVVSHHVLSDGDARASNTGHHPRRVTPRLESGAELRDGRLVVGLPPLSWNVIRLSTKDANSNTLAAKGAILSSAE